MFFCLLLEEEGNHDLPALGVGGEVLLVLLVLLDSPEPHLASTREQEKSSWKKNEKQKTKMKWMFEKNKPSTNTRTKRQRDSQTRPGVRMVTAVQAKISKK